MLYGPKLVAQGGSTCGSEGLGSGPGHDSGLEGGEGNDVLFPSVSSDVSTEVVDF